MKNLIVGDGLLGSELIKQTGWDYICWHKDGFDASQFDSLIHLLSPAETIINCIGYTNTYDKEKEIHWRINYGFVANLVDFCKVNNKKLVHISTDYIFANAGYKQYGYDENDIPVHQETWYAYCKLLADGYVQLRLKDYLMFRCSFKPRPFPYEKAYTNVWGNFDYVDVVAGQMIELINEGRTGIWNIGSEYKSVYQLAVETRPDVGNCENNVLPSVHLDIRKFKGRNR